MSLREIVRVLGGDLYDGGRRANVPAPDHSRADRSVSLLLQDDRVVVHSFGGADWWAVLDDLRQRRLIDEDNALLDGRGHGRVAGKRSLTELERAAAAMALWDRGRPIAGTLSAVYLRGRAIRRDLPGPGALRHYSDAPVAVYRDGHHRRPAFLAGIQDPTGDITGIEITYLTGGGRRADDLRLPRKTVGLAPAGSAVRLDRVSEAMLVGEGVPTTLSATERFGLPGWALLSTRNLRSWRPPWGVRSVLIAADRGADGEASADTLRRRLRAEGLSAWVELPPAPLGDWNDWAQAR
jgi:hypothetical protein